MNADETAGLLRALGTVIEQRCQLLDMLVERAERDGNPAMAELARTMLDRSQQDVDAISNYLEGR